MNKKLNGNSRAGMFPAKVSTLAFALVSAAVTAHAQFLGPANPGFENGSASWFQGGTGGAAGSVSYANSPTNGPSAPGTNCLRETSDGTGNVDFRASYFSLGMASQGTNPVTFSFDYQILEPVASGDRIRVGLRFENATGGFLEEHNFYIGTPNGDVGGDGWQHFTGTATASSASLTADIRVSMNAFGGDDHWTSGPVLFDNFSVVADAPPTVTQPTVSPATNVAAPTTLILQVTAQGAPPIGNQWRKNAVPLADGTAGSGSVLSGSLSNMLVISNTHTSDSGSYDVVVTNSFGSVTSAVAVVTVSAQLFPPSITSIVSDPVNGTNDLHTGVNPMTITVTAQGTGPLAYQWRKNGGNLLNQTNAVLSIPNALTNSGSYTVVVSNSVASITSSSPTVITVVDSAPIALTLIGGTNISTLINTVFVDPGYTVTDDYGSPVTVTVTGTVNTNACGGYMLTYTARDLLGNTNIMSRTVNVCLVADSFNESSLANAAVSKAPGWSASAIWLSDGMLHDFTYQTDGLDPHLTPNVGDPGALAGSGYLNLGNASQDARSLVWKDTSVALKDFQVTNIDFYTLNNDGGATVQIAIRVSTNWYVSAATFADSTGGVAPWAQQSFVFTTSAAAWQSLDPTTLQPSGVPLSGPLPNYSVSAVGFLASMTAGPILVDEFTATGTPASFPLTPPAADQPTVAPLNPNDGTAWSGTPLVFRVNAVGSAPLYSWRKDGVPINGANSNPWLLTNPGTGDSGNYDVVVTNSADSVTSAVVAVTVSAGTRPATAVLPLVNPGFELGSTGWNQGGTGGAAGSVSFNNSPRNGLSMPGTNCVMETSDGTGNVDFRANFFSLDAAAYGASMVTFSFDYSILGPVVSGDRIRVGLRFEDPVGGFLGERNSYIGTPNGDAGGNGWQHFSVTALPTGTAVNADIRVSMNVFGDDHWTSGAVLFDNFTVTVGPNTSPVAFNRTMNAFSGLAAAQQIIGGTNPPFDLDGDPLIVSTVGTPGHGTASTDGTNITYTANSDFVGTDAFNYSVSDQVGGMDSATVTVTVNSAGSNRLGTPVKLDATHYLLTYSGISLAKYALEWTGSLRPPTAWMPQTTNTAAANGMVNFTNQQLASPGFWRIRYVP